MKSTRLKRVRQIRAARRRLTPTGGPANSASASFGAALLTGSFALATVPVHAGGLPVPCPGAAATCSGVKFDKLNTGSTLNYGPNSLTINQNASSAIFNWQSFNISSGNTVQFLQPSISSVALNRIFDPNVTTIAGNLKANGQIYLINPNGILFGSGANVNVGGLIASTSNIKDERITTGLLYDVNVSNPVFTNDPTALGSSAAVSPTESVGAAPSIVVQPGATLYAAGRDTSGTIISAGRVFLFAPTVENGGLIKVDGGGQVILASGSNVFLGSSSDVSLRGLLVEINGSSNAGVTVDPSGTISVARGNITLMGLSVNQNGTLSATSALDANGSIRLIARQVDPTNTAIPVDHTVLLPVSDTGQVSIGSGSQTLVRLDPTDTQTAPLNDPTAAATRSTIDIQGAAVNIGGSGAAGSTLIEARGGDVTVTARRPSSSAGSATYALGDGGLLGASDPNDPTGAGIINVGSDATIDVSGLQHVQVDGARNFVYISRLTSTNLANAPYQRSGFLLGQSAYVNLNQVPSWLDVSNLQAAVAGTQAERNTVAGTIALRAEGSVNLARGSTLNVSGGSVDVSAAIGRTSRLITANGAVVDISNASADVQYIGFSDHGSATAADSFEGINQTTTWQVPAYTLVGGYTQGKNAGTVEIYASNATLNGTLLGGTTVDPTQRASLPLGGQLRINSNAVANLDSEAGIQRANVLISGDAATLAAGLSPGLAGNTSGSTIGLDAGALVRQGFTRLDVTSDGVVELAPGGALNLGPGGQFAARGNAVVIDASIVAPGGSVSVAERPLSGLPSSATGSPEQQRSDLSLVPAASPLFGLVTFASGTRVDTAGLWTNDELAPLSQASSAPVVLNGGSISVSGNQVDVSGASFDVTAGGWLSVNGKFSGGAGGRLSIAAMPSVPIEAAGATAPMLNLGSDFGARVSGFGVTHGGSLTIGAADLQLGGSTPSNPASVIIDPAVAQRGFESFSFKGYNLADVAAATQFVPGGQRIFNGLALPLAVSGSDLLSVGSLLSPLPGTAVPEAISISAANPFGGTLAVETGAVLNAGVGGTIALKGATGVQIDGTLRARAGSVAVSLGAPDPNVTLQQVDARSVQLGPDATIDVSGASLVTQLPNGLRTGQVLDAGKVSLSADTGTVAIDPGALINERGTSDAVDVPVNSSRYQRESIASAGGKLEISATNGVYVEGQIDAHAGGASAENGALLVAVTGSSILANQPDVLAQLSLPTDLSVTDQVPVLTPQQASFAPLAGLSGQAVVAPGLVNSAGFDRVWLQSVNTITFQQSVQLKTGSALMLAAPSLVASPGADVTLSSPYIALGRLVDLSSPGVISVAPPAATTGTGSLRVNAGNVDLVGDFSLQGIGQATISSTGDVRGIGVQGAVGVADPTRAFGSLSFGGNVQIDAAQVYPATQTDFVFDFVPSGTAADAGNGALAIAQNPAAGAALAPLSAGGQLAFNVNSFVSSGRVVAPLGSIDVTASQIALQPGSTLSVAGTGVVPYGTVLNGTTWTYGIPASYSGGIASFTLASSAGVTVPAKGINLNAGVLNAMPGSIIDIAGGGDVLGTGFVAGPGGSYDMSQNFPYANSPTRNPYFALIPSRGTAIAPFDPQIYGNLQLYPTASSSIGFQFGQTITIAAGSVVPAGTYTVMPARYALLPGAYAVTAAAGYPTIMPGQSVQMPDGTTIVAGQLGFADAGTAATTWSGYRVYTGAQFRQLSEFHDYYGTQFFASTAGAINQLTPRLGADAGSLQIGVTTSALLASTIDAAPSGSGRGADIALDAPSIDVGGTTPIQPQPTLQLDAKALSDLGAETLVLGALEQRRSIPPPSGAADQPPGSAVTLSNPTASVTVEGGSNLSAGEVVLTGSSVTLQPGATVAVNRAGSPSTAAIDIAGDGAALYVGNVPSVPSWQRTATTGSAGDLVIGSAASVAGTSVLLDASHGLSLSPTAGLQVTNLGLSTTQVNLGDSVPSGATGLTLTPALLAQLGSAASLSITSPGGVDVYGNAGLGATDASGAPVLANLTLIGPGIFGAGGPNSQVAMTAGHIRLDNSVGDAAPAGSSGQGRLALNSIATGRTDGSIEVAGAFEIGGFQSGVTLNASGRAQSATQSAGGTGELRFTGNAGDNADLSLMDSGAPLAVNATRITALRGVNASINGAVDPNTGLPLQAGAVTIGSSGPAQAPEQGELGASLTIYGRSIDVAGRIDLPAGMVQIAATGGAGQGDLTLESGSLIRVAGVTQSFASTSADASAGTIRLSAANGSIDQLAGATLDIGGTGTRGDAGTLQLSAANGTVQLQGTLLATPGSSARGADLSIDASALSNFSALAQTIATGAGAAGADSISLRARGGNITVASTDTMKAASILLEADGAGGSTDGSVSIQGRLEATGPNGGQIAVYASNQAMLGAGAQLDASASASGGTGGQVLVSARVTTAAAAPTTLDAIVLNQGATINVSGGTPNAGGVTGTGGTITLRANANAATGPTDVEIAQLPAGSLIGARQNIVEGVVIDSSEPLVGGAVRLSTALMNAEAARLSAYMSTANRSAMLARLDPSGAIAGGGTLSLRPDLEIRSTGDITIANPIDFATGLVSPISGAGTFKWRYGGSTLASSDPGVLTLRAQGNLNVNANISDGFAPTLATAKTLNSTVWSSGESWSYRLTSGADLSASNPNQITSAPANLNIGTASATSPVTVRSGTGSIALNSGQDVVLRNGAAQQSNVVYTAGVADVIAVDGSGNPVPLTVLKTGRPQLTEYGGNLSISAGRDVLGTDGDSNLDGSAQSVTDWLWRGGLGTSAAPTVWWVNFGQFQQGFGVLGGGNLTLNAGRNLIRVDAVVASNGYDVGSGVSERNRGALTVTAAATVEQGLYYDEAGRFDLSAAAFVSNPNGPNVATQAVRLAQGDNPVDLQARETSQIALPFNPTAATASALNTTQVRTGDLSSFFTFGGNSEADARVAAGDLAVTTGTSQNAHIVAPILNLVSFGGGLHGNSNQALDPTALLGGVVQLPSANGQLQLLADRSISGLEFFMSQADPALQPMAVNPQASPDVANPLTIPANISGGASLHANDPDPARIVARNGSLSGIVLSLPKTTDIEVGGDIRATASITLQNSNADSLTTISAGHQIDLSAGTSYYDGFNVGGAGAAQIVSGGAMNLGTDGFGIVSSGNLGNQNLAAGGASLIVVAGAGRDARGLASLPDYTGLIDNFIRYDSFASSGASSAALNAQVLAALGKDPTLASLVDALKAGLSDRASVSAPNSAFNQQIANLTPAQLAMGAVKLASAVQVVDNKLFVQSQNADTFAPAYAAFADLFPTTNDYSGAIRQFVLNNVFAKAGNGASLQQQSLQGLPAALANAIQLGLAAPASVNDPNSAFSKAVAAIDPATLANGMRQLLANALQVAGASRDALQAAGRLTGNGSPYAKELTAFAASFASKTAPGLNDLQMDFNQIAAQESGSIAVFAPQGGVLVGQSSPPVEDGVAAQKLPSQLGMFTYGGGDVIGMVRDNLDVFRSRVFTVAGGDINLWSSLENIDAGRGPRDVAVAPPPRLVFDANGVGTLDVSATVSGSGIGALKTSPTQPPSDINLMAPAGYVDAGEAGIRAESGTVTLGTNLVLNAGNIQAASGVSGGAVVAAPPPPLPPSTGTGAGDRAIEEVQREAAAQQAAAAIAEASQRRMRITGEFIGFETDCGDASSGRPPCDAAKDKDKGKDGK